MPVLSAFFRSSSERGRSSIGVNVPRQYTEKWSFSGDTALSEPALSCRGSTSYLGYILVDHLEHRQARPLAGLNLSGYLFVAEHCRAGEVHGRGIPCAGMRAGWTTTG
jgi:hypothetical protein